MDERVFYRGLDETWREDYAKNQHLIFITPDWDYARVYAKDDDHVLSFHADLGHSFDLGFRSLRTEVQLSEVVTRIKATVMEQFKKGHISKAEGIRLTKDLGALHYPGHREVWGWYMHTANISGPLIQILSDAGFNSIEGHEGTNNDVLTYGVFQHSQLRKI